MPAFSVAGESLWYETAGPEDGRPLLLLHGFTGSHATWTDFARWAAAQGRYVVAPDLYGHGRSSCPTDMARWRLRQIGADVWALLTALTSRDAVILGYSMGARLALDMALTWPERVQALILESGSPGIADEKEREERRAADDALARRIEAEGVAAFVAYWEGLPLFSGLRRLDAPRQERLRAIRLAQRPEGLAGSLRGSGTGSQPPRWDDLPRFERPVLVVVGAEDAKYQAIGRAMAERLPQARLVEIADSGHTPHLEQPERFVAAVAAFLEALDGH
jgi:2-succinyl-6-hydroxy-2,4-cyclohexadiene-1-carboxylate synthase